MHSFIRATSVAPAVLFLFHLHSCASPPREPLDGSALAAGIAARAASPAELAAAIEIAGQVALPLERPSAAELEDPLTAGYWLARAYAWNPAVRAARAALIAARARAGVSGAPAPLELEADNVGLGRDDAETELALTFDLLGLVGRGRAAAAREQGAVLALAAHQELERALWSARHEVERARLGLAAARARIEALATLASEADLDRARIEILARHGRVPAAELDWAWAMRAEVDFQVAMARLDEEQAREQLALATGLPPDASALDQISAGVLDEYAGGASLAAAAADPSEVELLERVPELRAARLEYALAEARLRAAAAEAWPEIRLGPQAGISADEWVAGGVLQIAVPWPGAARGAIDAALAERTRTRERVEEALLERLAELSRLRAGLEEIGACVIHNARPIDDASRSMWNAARTRFRLGTAELEDWSFALEHRIEPMLARIETTAILGELAIDYREARGPLEPGEVLARAGNETAGDASRGPAMERRGAR